jgi:hypothetical protein
MIYLFKGFKLLTKLSMFCENTFANVQKELTAVNSMYIYLYDLVKHIIRKKGESHEE